MFFFVCFYSSLTILLYKVKSATLSLGKFSLLGVGTMLDLLALNTKSECVLKAQASNQTMPHSLVKSQLAFGSKYKCIRKK